jgi:hypothetical protein
MQVIVGGGGSTYAHTGSCRGCTVYRVFAISYVVTIRRSILKECAGYLYISIAITRVELTLTLYYFVAIAINIE